MKVRTVSIACLVPLAASAGLAVGQTVTDDELVVETVATIPGEPLITTMAFLAPDDFLVLEKATGRVRRVTNGVVDPTPVLDVAVNSESERGLLGIAVNGESPPEVFLYFTEADGADGADPVANRVYRYDWNPAASALENPVLVLDLPVFPGPNHDGGILVLGEGTPGGEPLYAVIGDLNRNGQLQNFPAGDPPDDTGVIFRVTQDGAAFPGNPFTPWCSATTGQTCAADGDCPGGESCVVEVARYFAYGVRNSFGLALDPATGFLWDTENGPASYDEVNRVPPGMNSGWEQIMGPDDRDPQGTGDLFDMPGAGSTYSDPEFSWFDPVAPTSIVFPWGSALGPAYDGVALVGDNNTGSIYRFPLGELREGFDFTGLPAFADLVADDGDDPTPLRFGSDFGRVTNLEIGPDGHLYVVSLLGGTIRRIRPVLPTHRVTTAGDLPDCSIDSGAGPDGVCSTLDPMTLGCDGACSLRAALGEANASATADRIFIDVAGPIDLGADPLTVASDVTIDGCAVPGGATIRADDTALLIVAGDIVAGDATLCGLTLR